MGASRVSADTANGSVAGLVGERVLIFRFWEDHAVLITGV